MDNTYSMEMLDKGKIHILGVSEWYSVRFYHATQDSTQFKTYELFISGISYLIFLDWSWPQVIEAMESETTYKEGLLYSCDCFRIFCNLKF